MTAPKQALASLVRRSRLESNLTQADLAASVPMGISTLRQIEDGKADGPSLFTVLALLNALNLDPARLQPVSEQLKDPVVLEQRAASYRRRHHSRQRGNQDFVDPEQAS